MRLFYQMNDLRQQISLVDQNVILFNDTVAGNIAYGALGNADRNRIAALPAADFGPAEYG